MNKKYLYAFACVILLIISLLKEEQLYSIFITIIILFFIYDINITETTIKLIMSVINKIKNVKVGIVEVLLSEAEPQTEKPETVKM